jgi:phosphoglycerate kinase
MGEMKKLTIEDLDVKGKRVLVRVDFNVPQDDKLEITDDTRIKEAIPTIKYLSEKGGRVILVSHLGRPKGKVDKKYSIAPAADRLSKLMEKPVMKMNEVIGDSVTKASNGLKDGEIMMLENVRYLAGEEKNDPELSKGLAALCDVYVNDAFGTAHRAHASTEGVAHLVSKAAAGFLLVKEMKYLSESLDNPKRPFTAILGGAKVAGKLEVIKTLLQKVDNLLIGGGMAYTFLRAMKMEVGKSLVDESLIPEAKNIIKEAVDRDVKWLFPFDHVVTDKIGVDGTPTIVTREGFGDKMGVDIGPSTIEMFDNVIRKSGTVFWNGPMGVFEIPQFAQGTFNIALTIASSGAVSVVGGGDSVAAINKLGIASKFTHISTGGGASLEMVEGKVLPGIAALTDK